MTRIEKRLERADQPANQNLVWLASFPRSGNTLIRTILHRNFGLPTYSLYNDRHDIGKNEQIRELVGHEDGEWGSVEEGFFQCPRYPEKIDELAEQGVTIVKTHSQYCSFYRGAKIIYVVRDPRAAIRSLVTYQRDFATDGRRASKILKDLTDNGHSLAGHWSDHVSGWLGVGDGEIDLLVIKFEEVLRDFDNLASRLEHFLGIPFNGKPLVKFDEVSKVDSRFFRRGVTQGWDDLLDIEAEEDIWQRAAPVMQALGYSKPQMDYRKPRKLRRFLRRLYSLRG